MRIGIFKAGEERDGQMMLTVRSVGRWIVEDAIGSAMRNFERSLNGFRKINQRAPDRMASVAASKLVTDGKKEVGGDAYLN